MIGTYHNYFDSLFNAEINRNNLTNRTVNCKLFKHNYESFTVLSENVKNCFVLYMFKTKVKDYVIKKQ